MAGWVEKKIIHTSTYTANTGNHFLVVPTPSTQANWVVEFGRKKEQFFKSYLPDPLLVFSPYSEVFQVPP